ncbi:MAG: EAL domain-containing protein [Rhodobacter sp.]|nr:EAL domain-containing protein [Rhodobacter sp.]
MNQPAWLQDFNAAHFMREAEDKLTVAMQPIVDAETGNTIAYESLVRSFDDLGFPHPGALFEHAATCDQIYELDTCLIGKALDCYAELRRSHWSLLFVNLDGRLLNRWRDVRSFIEFKLDALDLRPLDVCIELSEAHQPLPPEDFAEAVEGLRKPGFLIAVDDFGTGNSGMQMLYQSSPDFIKIDRFFIKSMPNDAKKRLLVGSVVDLAQTLGARVIAEGVESVEELASCREVNCDLIQGFLIARPTTEIATLHPSYGDVVATAPPKSLPNDEIAVENLLEDVEILSDEDSLRDLIELMGRETAQSVFPTVDNCGLPRGAVRERDVKPLLYSRYGRDLAQNAMLNMSLMDYVRPIAMLESNTPLAPRLELIAEKAEDGVIVTKSLKYRGYLSSASLLKLANHIRLKQAAAQNPLTRLPGNGAIQEFLDKCIATPGEPRIAAYLDIDNFKPFNDKYGFEVGDRALLMMAALLKSLDRDLGLFVGHIGGDDFFVGAFGPHCAIASELLSRIGARFRHIAESLYDAEDRAAGVIAGRARDGTIRAFPLLSCTVSAVEIPAGVAVNRTLEITSRVAVLKSRARREGKLFLCETLGTRGL